MHWHLVSLLCHFAVFDDAILPCVGKTTKIHCLTIKYRTASSPNFACFNIFEIWDFVHNFLIYFTKFLIYLKEKYLCENPWSIGEIVSPRKSRKNYSPSELMTMAEVKLKSKIDESKIYFEFKK